MWIYNGEIFKNKKEMREKLNWSRTKWKEKAKDGKIKLINEEATLYETICKNS